MRGPTTNVPPGPPDPPPPPELVATGAGISHRGLVRAVNEDAILIDPTGALWAVADGMGGHGHGDLAADLAIDALARVPHVPGGRSLLRRAFDVAQAEVRRRAAADRLGEIGATLVALLVEDGGATLAWAGDSRAYRLRRGTLERLTHDHSLVQELVDRGEISAAEAELHPQRHIVTRAVGAGEAAPPDFADLALEAGDVFLLCSDGLTRCVPDPAIATFLATAGEPAPTCRSLVEAALAAGAPDNVSVVVVSIGEAPR
ncbi:protein phosphatase 2C domain-containing protein [Amaricoccus sp.]|uniref:PP2C family protein-serine/threonine phosphatase n=1 Tax=Amaricoccus sp. TaxID=1872485 RepID=UPI00261B7E34|nr:protein phosphatase 2C domain-containing protein [Amaricoccus sp.]HRO11423.1 protein phosphatase 2C domain-containing protein [Amaricoccus sp.]